MRKLFAILVYEVSGKPDRAGLGIGFLVETPDGRAWCFPTDETKSKFPGQDTFEVISERLKRQPDTDDGRLSYVYTPDSPFT
jgi:hypothetical protein